MTTTKMVRGVMAMLLLVGCGDAATTEDAEPSAPAIQGEGSSAPSPGTTAQADDEARPDESTSTTGGTDALPDATKPAPADCSKRSGGALITFNKGAEAWTAWSTNQKLNVELMAAAMKGTYVTLSFNDLVDGVDCDGQFTWHVDAENVSLDADYDPLCDALPSEVEANKAEWMKRDQWCPSKVLVSSIQSQ